MLFRRPFIKRFTLCHRTAVCLSVLSCLSVCDVGVLWPNGCMDQDAIWCEVGLGPGRIMLDRDQVPPKRRGHTPQFSALEGTPSIPQITSGFVQ